MLNPAQIAVARERYARSSSDAKQRSFAPSHIAVATRDGPVAELERQLGVAGLPRSHLTGFVPGRTLQIPACW
jgi:hypothetical protein